MTVADAASATAAALACCWRQLAIVGGAQFRLAQGVVGDKQERAFVGLRHSASSRSWKAASIAALLASVSSPSTA